MKVSYKKLWKLLIDRDMTQADLRKLSGLSSGSMTKMRQSEPVSMDVLWKVCTAIGCNIGDVVEFDLGGDVEAQGCVLLKGVPTNEI